MVKCLKHKTTNIFKSTDNFKFSNHHAEKEVTTPSHSPSPDPADSPHRRTSSTRRANRIAREAASTIARYWRQNFRHNTLHSLVCQMRKKGLFFDAVDDQMRYD